MSGFTLSLEIWTAVVIGAVVVVAMVQLILRRRSAAVEAKGPAWRWATLIALQPLAGGLLHLTLFPPDLPLRMGTLVVATAGSPETLELAPGEFLVALPEAGTVPTAASLPDLATALRQNPEAARLRIVGQGLEPRDQQPLPLPVVFEAPLAPAGIVNLALPRPAAPGERFTVGGQIGLLTTGTVELVDPSGGVVDRRRVAAGARFNLASTARAPGLAIFELRLRGPRGALVERIDVPVETRAQPQPRVLVLAGAPNAETKFLGRWAQGAGLDLELQIDLGGGARVGENGGSMDRQSLGDIDLLILDDRRWETMAPSARAALSSAVESGLGVLLRPTGPLSAGTRRDWAELGAPLSGGGETRPLRLDPQDFASGSTNDGDADERPQLERRDLMLDDDRSISLLRDAGGASFAGWRARGQGRVGVWTATDTYVLALSGDPQAHGALWSALFSALARPQEDRRIRLDGLARIGRRATLCGLSTDMTVWAPDGGQRRLLIDPASGLEACAGYWPVQGGWHVARDAEGKDAPFYVHPADAAPSLSAAEKRRATVMLAAKSGAASGRGGSRGAGSSWPWFAALVATLGVLWTVERSRRAPDKRMARS